MCVCSYLLSSRGTANTPFDAATAFSKNSGVGGRTDLLTLTVLIGTIADDEDMSGIKSKYGSVSSPGELHTEI
jgi:hypothetical protein